jgi:hypothetical protein
MRTVKRQRHYVARHWLALLRPLFAYNYSRNAYVLRAVGRKVGPVLCQDRRVHRDRPMEGIDRRRGARRRASWA